MSQHSFNPVQKPLTLIMQIKSKEDYEQLNGTLQHIKNLPPEQNIIRKSLDEISTVHFARFTFLENNTKLAVITSYDGDRTDYLNAFIDNIGEIFDAILKHMQDAPPLPVKAHREEFIKYVEAHDVDSVSFYSAYPRLTVRSIRSNQYRADAKIDFLDLADIQGIVLHGHGMPYVRHWVLRIENAQAAKCFIGSLVNGHPVASPQITNALPWKDKPAYCLNIGFTYEGLKALELPNSSLNTFPQAFIDGSISRAKYISDTGDNAPDQWKGELGTSETHSLLSLYAQDSAILDSVTAILRSLFTFGQRPAATELACHDGKLLPDRRTHFGYKDGISQPNIEGAPIKGYLDSQPIIPAGEFLLGYPNQDGFIYPFPLPHRLGVNGSFAVFRIIEQDVLGFCKFLHEKAAETGLSEEKLAAKLCGRWRNGMPLALSPESDLLNPALARKQLNDFDYSNDPKGYGCPVGAHIRRLNPRDGTLNNIQAIRRGMPYGPPYDPSQPDDGIERGLLGFFIGAAICDQFEFLMEHWINQGNSSAALSEKDRLVKDPIANNTAEKGLFIIPALEGELRISGFSSFVKTRGSAYCFLPSLSALSYLARV